MNDIEEKAALRRAKILARAESRINRIVKDEPLEDLKEGSVSQPEAPMTASPVESKKKSSENLQEKELSQIRSKPTQTHTQTQTQTHTESEQDKQEEQQDNAANLKSKREEQNQEAEAIIAAAAVADQEAMKRLIADDGSMVPMLEPEDSGPALGGVAAMVGMSHLSAFFTEPALPRQFYAPCAFFGTAVGVFVGYDMVGDRFSLLGLVLLFTLFYASFSILILKGSGRWLGPLRGIPDALSVFLFFVVITAHFLTSFIISTPPPITSTANA